MASLSNPNPIITVFNPKTFSKSATIGILPPLRTGMAGLPNVVSYALLAALNAIESTGVTTGSPP